jgi:hypothetical protein
VSPLLDIQRFRRRSSSMLSAEVAGGAVDGADVRAEGEAVTGVEVVDEGATNLKWADR